MSFNIRNAHIQALLARKPVDSIRTSFKSSKLSSLKKPESSKPIHSITKNVLRSNIPSAPQIKQGIVNINTNQNSRRGCSQIKRENSRMKMGGSVGGINDRFLYQRKQNHLNTCFNIRKNKLQEITKINKQIYQRLNSQKSLYSNKDLNKSYQSIKAIKDRMSQSRMSQRSNLSKNSSKSSLRSSKAGTKPIQLKKKIEIKVKAESINHVQFDDLDKFKILFQKNSNMKSRKTIDSQEGLKAYSYRRNGAYMRSIKASGRSSVPLSKESTTNIDKNERKSQGGLLHRIVEDWQENKENTKKKIR